jgi:predicted glycogen debranching enzyme
MSEVARRQDLLAPFPDAPEHIRQLHLAADSFIVKGQEGTRAVIAGYHWFGDWGRDTMIALPGLTLAANRLSDARDILSFHLEQMSRGLIPNFLPERGESPAYNSIDATLWLFVAAYEYFRRSNDLPFLRDSLYPALVQSITWHVNGTDHGIVVDRDGLLMGGDETTQLTWMDATTDGCPVTPRQGKPVEVNALWYNACRIMQEFAHILHCEGEGKRFGSLARKAKASFQKAFWNPDKGCLFDCVGEGKSDSSVRPNQVFALSLPFPLLAGPKATSLMKVVERELLIPFGLRSLSPEDGRYIGRYAGDQRHRDGAYHQGTAWAWLLGPFLAAYLRVHRGGRARHRAAEILASFSEHLSDAGLGTISENFDGDPPHTPCGCISQAWSVATVLDAYWRFVSPSLAAGG